ncbi:uncharacterized protein EV154DRAFT_515002 [Mucor mucedo]|uniref:uncharacterized protein n=1 Tax=Mucor mucedo TaxID=29922 RepID=UPI00222126A5|nr:uncharacterized protein EV154DRAFT_515002 [Mucor mucedo]KAI7889262.1 hypothetical protein EV154DRAFT_515002 [Mucor mucedo]
MTTMMKSRSPSLGTLPTMTSVEMPMPSISITNKPSCGTSLYHTCRSVLDRLSLVEGMTHYLELESPSTTSPSESVIHNTSNDPLTKLWELCRRGTPLATLFNALNPVEPLKAADTTTQQQTSECKKTVYHFIVACRNQLLFTEDQVFTLSDVYKDSTNGFVKVVNTIDAILQLLEEKGIISSFTNNRNSLNAPKDTRDKVVHEMLETERKYVQDLEILQNYMREVQIQEVLNPDTIHYVFGNLNSLVDFQRRFLIQLEEVGEKCPEDQNFGYLFSQNEDLFAVYEPFCSNFCTAQDLVVQEIPKLVKLSNILNPYFELPSMLIKPVQRICKYPLLLNQLIKSTKPDWPHYAEMELGLESVKRVTEKVNETQRKYENIQVVEELKKRVDEMKPQTLESYGSLLLHEKLIVQQPDEPSKEMYIYFFERTILICKETKEPTKHKPMVIRRRRAGSLQPKGLIAVSRIIAVRNKSTGEGNWLLAIDWKDREVDHLTLKFRNEEHVKLWESTLKGRMSPMKSSVSNTQLASMKTYSPQSVPAFLRTDEDDEDDDDDEDVDEDEHQQQRLRANSLSAHLIHSISGRPKIPRNMSDTARYNHNPTAAVAPPLPRTSSSTNTHDYYNYPVSPPPSNPSSPTSSARASQSSSTTSNRMRDGSPLADIASKFMSTTTEEYSPPPKMNRSQSAYPGDSYPLPQHTVPTVNPSYIRLRSQSSPNIHNNTSSSSGGGHKWEDAPQLPFNSRTLYQTPPSPSDSPTRDSHRPVTSHSSRLSDVPTSPISGTLKLKLNYSDGIYVVMCSMDILFYELMEKVERKIRLVANLQPNDVLRLRYQDEDGDLITINSDDDVQMAFESKGNANSINLFVSV